MQNIMPKTSMCHVTETMYVIESKNLRTELAYKAWSTVDGLGGRRICSSIAGVATQ